MATAGSGDVLAGMMAGLAAQEWPRSMQLGWGLFCMVAPAIWQLGGWGSRR